MNKKNFFNLFFILWVIALITTVIEVFTYDGFFFKHTNISVNYIFITTLVLGIVVLIFKRKDAPTFYPLLRNVNMFCIVLFFLALLIFSYLEQKNYPNYVYSTFHLQTNNIKRPLILCIYLFVLEGLVRFKNTFSIKGLVKVNLKRRVLSFKPLVPKILMQALIILVFVSNLSKISNLFKKDIFFMISKPLATYNEKMQRALGGEFYDFTLFIKQYVPPDATILIPPQGYPWPQSGNKFYLRYFVYPRKLLNGKEYEPSYDYKKDGVDYILIAWGESSASQYGYTNGWPKFDVPAEDILFMSKNGVRVVQNKDYLYRENIAQHTWGIIKVKK